MDDGKGYLTWLPKYESDAQIQIVAQLDQLYAYMLMIMPSLSEPYLSVCKKYEENRRYSYNAVLQ